MKNKVNKFLLKAYKKGEIELIDICFSSIFDIKKDKYSFIYILFSSIISLSTRLGNVCLPIDYIFSNYIFSDYIKKFLFYFFSYININDCLNIMLINNIISFSHKNVYTPFILYNYNIYLYKYWYYENYIINFLNKNINFNYDSNIDISKLDFYINKFNINKFYKNIILGCIYNKITIISGSPGTGKSTLIVKLILVLYSIFNFKSKKNIILVSSTGKSSVLLTNYLNDIFLKLNINDNFINKLPNKCFTIHKFFKFNFVFNYIKFNKFNKLKVDYIIVDECSMISLNIIFLILSSLNYYTKIIFVGDYNQINSIEPGGFLNQIFSYINSNFVFNKYYLNYKNIIFSLIKNYRFNNNKILSKLIILIKNKDFIKLDNFLLLNNFSSNLIFYDSNKFNYLFFLKLCINFYIKYINFIKDNFDIYKVYNYFNKNQIICLLKNSNYGTFLINKYINDYLNKNFILDYCYFNKYFIYKGKPLLIDKNINELNLYNGDIGFFIFIKKKIRVFFKNIEFFLHPYLLKNNWIDCWSITVHKSQGSEYNNVFFVLPDIYCNLLDNNIIYTALSRAKKSLIIYGDINILIKAISNDNLKFSNIKNKLNF